MAAKEIPCLTGKGAPTERTKGAPGVLYMDIDTGDLFKCRGGSNRRYRWEVVGGSGAAPVKGKDYYTEDDKAEMVAMVLDALGENVISGYVDAENNVVIMRLPVGSYTVKYEMEDGSTIDIGGLELGKSDAPGEINYFDASKAMLNHRIGSSGSLSEYNGIVVSDFIPVDSSMDGKMFVVSGAVPVLSGSYNYYARTAFYDEGKVFISGKATNYDPWYGGVYPWGANLPAETTYVRVALVIKDGVTLTADDIANIKITLE